MSTTDDNTQVGLAFLCCLAGVIIASVLFGSLIYHDDESTFEKIRNNINNDDKYDSSNYYLY